MKTVKEAQRDLNEGIVTLNVQYFKTTGKWYAGGEVTIALVLLEKAQYDSNQFFMLIDKYQNELNEGAYKEFIVVVTEPLYETIEEYHYFFTRLFHPVNRKSA